VDDGEEIERELVMIMSIELLSSAGSRCNAQHAHPIMTPEAKAKAELC
jgi:hypothetical protein